MPIILSFRDIAIEFRKAALHLEHERCGVDFRTDGNKIRLARDNDRVSLPTPGKSEWNMQTLGKWTERKSIGWGQILANNGIFLRC